MALKMRPEDGETRDLRKEMGWFGALRMEGWVDLSMGKWWDGWIDFRV